VVETLRGTHGGPPPGRTSPLEIGLVTVAVLSVLAALPTDTAAQPIVPIDPEDRHVEATVVFLLPSDPDAATAPRPVSARKFGAMLARTLAAFGLEVRNEEGGAVPDRWSEAVQRAEDAGHRRKALGVVWLDFGDAPSASLVAHLLDRLTDTTLSRFLPSPPRADDEWYRAASLAVLTMLRSTLADVPDAVAGHDGLEGLLDEVEAPAPVRTVVPEEGEGMFPDLPVLAVEATYAGLAQPTVGLWQNGARFSVAYAVLPCLALGLDVDLLSDWTTGGRDYLLAYTQVPVGLTVRTALWSWLHVAAGLTLNYARAVAAYPDRGAVRSEDTFFVAPTVDLTAQVGVTDKVAVVLGLRAGFPLNRTRYLIWGQLVAEQSAVQVGVTAGLGMELLP